ncbi:oxidoreductase [Daldinia caldariorum]|uniref:oxidoreductase n=1 Tax=Daldinia caldariorum TaxID=326644 RepID=UPI002007868C|nr:oxidoreductase [Daldinia caldariorum]KAI1469515.1 oxidoreductase [Daldinia caldariorum]
MNPPPPGKFPILQTSFETPPDCGEYSYRGRGRLQGLNALITGGDSGIGRSVVIAFLREGANVAINYLPEEEPDVDDLANFLEGEGLSFERIPGDLLNETFVTELVHEAADRLGGLDIVVPNAGYSGVINGETWRPIEKQSTEQLERIFRTNVFANFFLVRAAVPLLPRGGSFVFTTSGIINTVNSNAVDYGASKASISYMIRSLSAQLAPKGIRVNGVAPSITYSPFLATAGVSKEAIRAISASNAYGRIEQPAELAPIYVNLADPLATYASGNIWAATGSIPGPV